MRIRTVPAILALGFILGVYLPAMAQRNPTPAIQRDPVMEADAKHNLDVAKQAFTPLASAIIGSIGLAN